MCPIIIYNKYKFQRRAMNYLLKAALDNARINQYNQGNSSPEQKLREQLYHCTYNDDTKFVIEKAVKQLLHVYPYFNVQILEFTQNGQQKRFLQIKGILEIEVRGKICKVDYNIMLPNSFPRKPPYVRIINRNSQHMVDPFYKSLRSPTDPKSFILNQKLTSVQNWSQNNSSLVNLVVESNKMMRENFPFSKAAKSTYQSSMNVNSGWANINNQQNNGWSNFNSNNNNNNPNFQNGGYIGNQGYSNQGFNNQGFNSQGSFQNNNNNYGVFNNNIQPPIPFNNSNTYNVNQIIVSGQKYVGESKKIIEKMKSEHIKAVQKIQHLQAIKFSLDSEYNYLQRQNTRMDSFLKNNQNSSFNDLTKLIQPKDDRSQQILDLSASIKAKQDCISLLQERFGANELTFDEFCRFVRKFQEEKFQEKVLLLKCTTQ